MAWYWGLVLFLAGLSGGLIYGVYRIRRLLSSLTEAGGASVSPAEIKKRVEEEFKDDQRHDEIVERLKKLLEGD